MNKKDFNPIYKKIIEDKAKDGTFCPFKREMQMDFIEDRLSDDFKGKEGLKVLDACSGEGRLIYFLNQFNDKQQYTGIDYIEGFIERSNEFFKENGNISFEERDIYNLSEKYDKEFDISINYKTMSWLPYYEDIVSELIKVTKSKIYITSLFYEGDADFEVKIRDCKHSEEEDNYSFLNTYSIPRFTDFCKRESAKKVLYHDMKLNLDLPKPEDPNELRTYTIKTTDDIRLEVTGVVLLNWKLVEIVL